MTTLTAHKALNFELSDVLELPRITLINQTPTSFTVPLGNGVNVNFTGLGIDPSKGLGTIKTATVVKDGVKLYSFTDFSLPFSGFPGNLLNLFDGSDTVNGSAAADFIYGFGGNDALNGNGGNDRMFGQGGNDTMKGGANNDTLRGGTGADKLFGDGSDDKLYGGTGHDTLQGGWGKDTFYFVDPIATRTTFAGWDNINEFIPSGDTIALKHSVFTKLLAAGDGSLLASQFSIGGDNQANELNDRIIYNRQTGEVHYDSNGSAANTAASFYVKIAELDLREGHPFDVNSSDFILV